MIICSRCGCNKDESEFSGGFSTCFSCRESARETWRKNAKVKKKEKKVRKEGELENKIASGDLNSGLRHFPSWESYKRTWGEKATMKEYIAEKQKFYRDSKIEKDEDENLIYSFPVVSDDCVRYRRMLIGLEAQDSIFMGIEHGSHNCKFCAQVYALVGGGIKGLKGIDLFNSHLMGEEIYPIR